MIVTSRGTGPTSPTELIAAHEARHVIATHSLLDSSATERTHGHIVSIFFDPALKLPIHGIITRDILSVPLTTTSEANLSLAFTTSQFSGFLVGCPYRGLTARSGAPANKKVRLQFFLFLKPLVFCKKLKVIELCANLPHVLDREFVFTLVIKAFHL